MLFQRIMIIPLHLIFVSRASVGQLDIAPFLHYLHFRDYDNVLITSVSKKISLL